MGRRVVFAGDPYFQEHLSLDRLREFGKSEVYQGTGWVSTLALVGAGAFLTRFVTGGELIAWVNSVFFLLVALRIDAGVQEYVANLEKEIRNKRRELTSAELNREGNESSSWKVFGKGTDTSTRVFVVSNSVRPTNPDYN